MSKRLLSSFLAVSFALLAVAATPGVSGADEAGDDIASPAGPLTGGVNHDGKLDTNTDVDWYVFYTQPQKPITISLTKSNAVCSDILGQLMNGDGDTEGSRNVYTNQVGRWNFTTQTSPARYYLAVYRSGCNGASYQINIAPPESVTQTPPGPQPGPTSANETEPNDFLAQANGPLMGAKAYGGQIGTDTDDDWFYFYSNAQKPIDIAVTRVGDGCHIIASLRDKDGDGIATREIYDESTRHFNFTTPVSPQKYYLNVYRDNCNGATYQFRIDGADAVTQTPPPPDADEDGVPDSTDACAQAAGPAPGGCPDSDGDGVSDNVDQCMREDGVAPTGCPDSDGDGVLDKHDRCESVRGNSVVGCPDSDGDGVDDLDDGCDRERGPAPSGCPVRSSSSLTCRTARERERRRRTAYNKALARASRAKGSTRKRLEREAARKRAAYRKAKVARRIACTP